MILAGRGGNSGSRCYGTDSFDGIATDGALDRAEFAFGSFFRSEGEHSTGHGHSRIQFDNRSSVYVLPRRYSIADLARISPIGAL